MGDRILRYAYAHALMYSLNVTPIFSLNSSNFVELGFPFSIPKSNNKFASSTSDENLQISTRTLFCLAVSGAELSPIRS